MAEMFEEFEKIFQSSLSAEEVAEASRYRTVPSGAYRLQVTAKEPRTGDQPFNLGRQFVTVRADLFAPDDPSVRKGRVIFDLDPLGRRDERTGEIDKPTKLWRQFAAAFDLRDNRALYEALDLYPVDAYVTEAFKKPEGGYSTPRTPDERRELVEQGLEPRNYVQNVRKVKVNA